MKVRHEYGMESFLEGQDIQLLKGAPRRHMANLNYRNCIDELDPYKRKTKWRCVRNSLTSWGVVFLDDPETRWFFSKDYKQVRYAGMSHIELPFTEEDLFAEIRSMTQGDPTRRGLGSALLRHLLFFSSPSLLERAEAYVADFFAHNPGVIVDVNRFLYTEWLGSKPWGEYQKRLVPRACFHSITAIHISRMALQKYPALIQDVVDHFPNLEEIYLPFIQRGRSYLPQQLRSHFHWGHYESRVERDGELYARFRIRI